MLGRCTLIATSCPVSRSTALYTCTQVLLNVSRAASRPHMFWGLLAAACDALLLTSELSAVDPRMHAHSAQQQARAHLAERCRGHGPLADEREHLLDGAAKVALDDLKRGGVWERRHVVLQHAQLVHVVLPDDVRPVGEHLAGLDVARTEHHQQLSAQCSNRLCLRSWHHGHIASPRV